MIKSVLSFRNICIYVHTLPHFTCSKRLQHTPRTIKSTVMSKSCVKLIGKLIQMLLNIKSRLLQIMIYYRLQLSYHQGDVFQLVLHKTGISKAQACTCPPFAIVHTNPKHTYFRGVAKFKVYYSYYNSSNH